MFLFQLCWCFIWLCYITGGLVLVHGVFPLSSGYSYKAGNFSNNCQADLKLKSECFFSLVSCTACFSPWSPYCSECL